MSANRATTEKVIGLVSAFAWDELAAHIHEDIVMEAPYQAFHNGPMKRGKAVFMAGMQFVPTVFSRFELTIQRIYDCPDQDSVVFEMASDGTFAADPERSYANRYLMVFGFRDGQVVLWREIFNPAIMNDKMGFMLGAAG